MLVLTGNKKGPGKSKPTVEFCGWIVAQLFYFCQGPQGLKIADDMLHCPFILGVGPTSYMSFVQPISASLSLATFAAKLVMRQWGEHALAFWGSREIIFSELSCALLCMFCLILGVQEFIHIQGLWQTRSDCSNGKTMSRNRAIRWSNSHISTKPVIAFCQ